MEDPSRSPFITAPPPIRTTEKSLVSVIVLNWNGRHLLDDSLGSLMKQTYSPLEILLVDNGSEDDSAAYVREKYPSVRILRNSKNLGFAGGNNVGLRQAEGKYILMLNNDTELDPHCIEELMKVAESSAPTIGSWGTKILSFDNRDIIDVCGIVIYPDGLGRGRGRLEPARDRYNQIEEIFFISDCAGLYLKKMIQEIGLYDEDFFNCNEELDLGFRAQLAGWKSLYVPTAVVYHRYSATIGKYSPQKAFLTERNRIWTAVKNFPPSLLWASPYHTLKRYFLQAYGALAQKGSAGQFTQQFSKGELVRILARAYFSAVKGFPRMLQKRKQIQENRKISAGEFKQLFRRFGIRAAELSLKD